LLGGKQMAVTNYSNVPTLMAELDKVIHVAGGGIYTPAYKMFSKLQRTMGTKEIWNKLVISSMKDTFTGTITAVATDTLIPVTGSTTNNNIKYIAGVTVLVAKGEKMLVTVVNSATSLTVIRAYAGTALASFVSGDEFSITYSNAIGVPQLGRDDTQYSTRNFNFHSNYQIEIPLDNLNKDGRHPRYSTLNEAAFDHQRKLKENELYRQIEVEFFQGTRYTEGDGPVSTAGVSFTAQGGKSFTGGLTQFISLDGGITDVLAGNPISEPRLRSQVRRLRLRGAFDDIGAMEESHSVQGWLLVPVEQGTMIQTIVDPLRILNDSVVKQFGTDVTIIDIEGVKLQLKRSIGIPKDKYFLVPSKKGLFDINIQRLMERQEDNVSGDRTTAIYENTWMNKFGNCFICLEAINCATPAI
jgi:hypothetical protein